MSDDPERDWPVVSRHVAAQLDSYRRYMVKRTGRPPPRPVDPDTLRERDKDAGVLRYLLYGTPDDVAADVRAATDGAPVETAYFWASIAGMPEEMVARQVELICTELAPRLA